MLKVKIINKGHQPLPAFATPQSAFHGIAGWL